MLRKDPSRTSSNFGTATSANNIRCSRKTQVGIWRRSGGSTYLVGYSDSARRDHPSCTPSKCCLTFRRPHCQFTIQDLELLELCTGLAYRLGSSSLAAENRTCPEPKSASERSSLKLRIRSNSYGNSRTRRWTGVYSRRSPSIAEWPLDNFLSFICGSSSAVTDVTGVATDGNEVWKRWGSSPCGPLGTTEDMGRRYGLELSSRYIPKFLAGILQEQ